MGSNSEIALTYFSNGFSCSQAVLVSHCEELGLDTEKALKVASAFGGGMGHIGETCGAVTGAFMLIGLKYGKYTKEDTEAKEKTYSLVKRYTSEFKKQHGSVKCKELIPYDISINEELEKAREAHVFTTICPKLVESSVKIVEKILSDDEK